MKLRKHRKRKQKAFGFAQWVILEFKKLRAQRKYREEVLQRQQDLERFYKRLLPTWTEFR